MEYLASGQRGSADLCAYFFLRANQLTSSTGGFGLVATNTIAQGDTREVGLDQLLKNGCVINRAVPSCPWLGSASLQVSHIWLRKSDWSGGSILDGSLVSGITAFLMPQGNLAGNPFQLVSNQKKSFQGSNILGMGFVMSPEKAQGLIYKNSYNRDVLFPYLTAVID